MHWTSLVTIGLLAVFTIVGWKAGLIRRVLELTGLLAAVVATAAWGGVAGHRLADASGIPGGFAVFVGGALLFIVALLITRLLAWGISKAVQVSVLGWLDHVGGAALGFVVGLFLVSLALLATCRFDSGGDLCGHIRGDTVTQWVHDAAPTVYRRVIEEAANVKSKARDVKP